MPYLQISKIQHYLRWTYYKHRDPAGYRQLQELREIDRWETRSLKGFDENECIFFHIPKTGGISINKALWGKFSGFHRPVNFFQIIFSPYEFWNYFKFTMVRNPWDRLVSAFFFLKKGGNDDADRRWSEAHLKPYNDFNTFVRKWVNEKNIDYILTFIHSLSLFVLIKKQSL